MASKGFEVAGDQDEQDWLYRQLAGTPWRLSIWRASGPFIETDPPELNFYATYSIHLVSAGALKYTLPNQEITLKAGEVALFPRRTPRMVTGASGAQALLSYIHFDPPSDRPDPLRAVVLPMVVDLPDASSGEALMAEVIGHIDALQAGDKGSRLLGQAAFLRLLHAVMHLGFDQEKVTLAWRRAFPPALTKALHLFEQRSFDPTLTMQQLAEAVGVSQGHFTRLFREHMGMAPKQYLMNRRLDRAMLLVKADHRPSVREIAHACGYADPFYFSRQFRERFGHPPTYFRDKA